LKAVFIVIDGMGDRPLKEHSWKTPLELATTPALDYLAKMGACGILYAIRPGLPPGSGAAMLSLLGYDPFVHYRGRGALEALGSGVDIQSGDVAFRTNFSSVDENRVVLERRAIRYPNIGDEYKLAKIINDIRIEGFPEVKVIFNVAKEYRGSLIFRGPKLSRMVSSSDPEVVGEKAREVKPLDDSQEAMRTAKIVNQFSEQVYQTLNDHSINEKRRQEGSEPANYLLIRGASTLMALESLESIFGIKTACISKDPMARGVAMSAGMDIIEVEGATGDIDTNALAKGQAVVDNIDKYDLIYVHILGSDVASHDGSLENKKMMIEKVDGMVKLITEELGLEETVIAVTADHATPIKLKKHTGDFVPLVIAGKAVITDEVEFFSERACSRGGLNTVAGIDLMQILVNLLGKAERYGA